MAAVNIVTIFAAKGISGIVAAIAVAFAVVGLYEASKASERGPNGEATRLLGFVMAAQIGFMLLIGQ